MPNFVQFYENDGQTTLRSTKCNAMFALPESMNYIYTKEAEDDNPFLWFEQIWIDTPRKEFFTFQVRACKEATILLSDVPVSISQVQGGERGRVYPLECLSSAGSQP